MVADCCAWRRERPRTPLDDCASAHLLLTRLVGAATIGCFASSNIGIALLPADADREKFFHVLGIHGDPVEARRG